MKIKTSWWKPESTLFGYFWITFQSFKARSIFLTSSDFFIFEKSTEIQKMFPSLKLRGVSQKYSKRVDSGFDQEGLIFIKECLFESFDDPYPYYEVKVLKAILGGENFNVLEIKLETYFRVKSNLARNLPQNVGQQVVVCHVYFQFWYILHRPSLPCRPVRYWPLLRPVCQSSDIAESVCYFT